MNKDTADDWATVILIIIAFSIFFAGFGVGMFVYPLMS